MLYFLLSLSLITTFILSLNMGDTPVSFFKSLWTKLDRESAVILWEIRLPRAIMAILVGASLGLSGAAMQGFLRNPLAEPGVMGVTGGAVLGAVLMFYTGLASVFSFALPVGGMIGACLSVVILYAVAGRMHSAYSLILAGVAINTLAFALTALALNLSKNPYASLEIVFWQMGSLADRSFEHVTLSAPFVLAGWILLLWDARAWDALTLGEETARSMGVSLGTVRFRLIVGTALCVGAAVSFCGSIGFVGLVVPHLLRPFIRYQPGKLLGVSALGGAILLLLADIGVRVIPSHTEIKLGVLTALAGAPFFIVLIFKMRRSVL